MTAPRFRRLVLEVGHGAAGPGVLHGAAELARLLGLGLHCVLIEDEALFDLPFARELRLPTHDWQPLDPVRLAGEFAAMAEALRRSLAALGASHGIAQALEVRRGDPQACLGGLCEAGDIIVLAEEAPGQRPRPQRTMALFDMARRSPASVLLLPVTAPPRATPVAALLAGPDDPGLAVAAAIAADAGADLVLVLTNGGDAAVAQAAARHGVPPARLAIHHAGGRDPASLGAALGAARERLLVLSAVAPGDNDLAAALVRARGIPVLVLESGAPVSA